MPKKIELHATISVQLANVLEQLCAASPADLRTLLATYEGYLRDEARRHTALIPKQVSYHVVRRLLHQFYDLLSTALGLSDYSHPEAKDITATLCNFFGYTPVHHKHETKATRRQPRRTSAPGGPGGTPVRLPPRNK